MYYRRLNDALKERFGTKVYKLALDGGFTCPNRDGTLDTRGCIFCSASGSGEFAQSRCVSVYQQIEEAKQRVGRKIKEGGYIAYFQNFTNTYAPVSRLEELFSEAISHPDVKVLSVATRPDCLELEKLELLARLNQIKPVWVELGLQTIHPETAKLIRRGYPLEVYDRGVRELKRRGIQVIVHMILGLPGETPEMIYETAEYIGRSGADSIKLQLLHVLKDTDLAKLYQQGEIQALELEEYITLLEGCIRRLPPEMVIHRLTGDGDKRTMLAPLWSGDKKRVLNAINRRFEADGLIQGSLWKEEG